METGKDNGLKPTFRRQRPGAPTAVREEAQKAETGQEVSAGVKERTADTAEAVLQSDIRQENRPDVVAAEEKAADKTVQNRAVNQKEKPQKDQSAEEYEQYIDNLSIYENNLKKEAVDTDKLVKAQEIRTRYKKQWDTAVKNAEDHWSKSLDDTVRRAQEERSKLRRQAEDEKRERQAAAERKEQNIKKQQQQALSREQQLCAAEKQLHQQLDRADSYVFQGYECNQELKSFLQGARQRKYFSKEQEELANDSIEGFCERWAGDADQLKNMESGLLGTDFVNKVTHFQIDDSFYGKLLLGGRLALFVVFSLILMLGYATGWGFFLSIGGFIISMAVAGIFYSIMSVVAMFIKRHKDQKVRDSLSGIIAWVLAIMLCMPLSGDFKRSIANNLAADLIYGAIGAVSVGAFFNIRLLRNFLSRIPAVVTLAYKDLFRGAERREGEFRARQNLLPLKEGTVDAMICCYINHDQIMQHLSASTREKLMKELHDKIAETQKAIKDCRNVKADLDEQEKKALGERKEVQRQNAETDARLKRQLEDVDRRYGGEEAPDFTKKTNLLAKDVRGLAGLEQEFEAIGFTSFDVSHRAAALKSSDQFITMIENRLENTRNEIKKNSGDIKKWMDSAKCPPQTYKNGRYRYAIDDRLCILNSVDMDDRRPVVINHNGKPVIFYYKGERDINRVVDFISQVWNGFARIAPANLLDMFVADSAGSVRLLLKKQNWAAGNDHVRNRFAQNYQEGYEIKRDAISDDREQSADQVCVRGIFAYDKLDTLMDGLVRQQDAVETYGKKNPENMMRAGEAVKGTDCSIALVNYCRGEKGSGHDMVKYQVVLFVVPEEKGTNVYNHEALSKLRSMIEADVAKDYGILPVFIASEHSQEENWNSLVALAEKQGIAYTFDMNSLRLAKKEA